MFNIKVAKAVTVLVLLSSSAFGCACVSEITNLFKSLGGEVIGGNLQIIGQNLDKLLNENKKSAEKTEKQTAKYQKMLQAEAAKLLELKEVAFNLEQKAAMQSKKNEMEAAEVETILKQNEQLIIELQKLLNKERS
jgi:hypothetical protein